MSQWSGTAQQLLDANEHLTLFRSLYAEPRRRDDNSISPVGYWSGTDDIDITLSGVQRTMQGIGDAITVSPIRSNSQTTIKTDSVTIFGLSPEGTDLYRSLTTQGAPAEVHLIAMNSGGVIVGSRVVIKGIVISTDMDIMRSFDGDKAELVIDISSKLIGGSRTIGSKKSKAHYESRGDTAFEYNHVSVAEGDIWKS